LKNSKAAVALGRQCPFSTSPSYEAFLSGRV
jgi:hypothetical protein